MKIIEEIIQIVLMVCIAVCGGFFALTCKSHDFAHAGFFLMTGIVCSFMWNRLRGVW